MQDVVIAYRSTAQCLLSDLAALELGPAEIARSAGSRAQAEAFIASFLRGADEPESPERFGRIAQQVADFLVEPARAVPLAGSDNEENLYRSLLKGLSAIFAKEDVQPYRE